jgi:hypothetical protein
MAHPPLTERQLLDSIGDLLDHHGLLWDHFRPARTQHGWVTPLQGHKGAPDLRIVGTRLIHAELKSDKGKLGDEQSVWLNALRAAGAEVYVWRPSDWWDGTIDRVLETLT